MRKVICYLLVFLMSISGMTSFAYGAVSENTVFSDMPENWSTMALEKAVHNGLMTGYDGKIQPNGNLKRAELATIINRAFGATQKSSLENYADVAANAWYFDEMAKAVCMKTFLGTGDGKLNPEKPITRQEVFLVFVNALKLLRTNTNVLNSFSDNQLISSWAKDATAALVSAGYVKGSEGLLKPQDLITRAEIAQILDNIAKHYIRKEGIYSTDVTGNVMINVPDVTLKDMTITGDLIIGDGVGNGDVTLDGIEVTGRTIIRGGGINSIRIIGNSHLGTVVIARVDGAIRVYAEDGTQIGEVIVDGSDDVIVEGSLGSLLIMAHNVTVTATNANIHSTTINGDNSSVIVNEKSEIREILINSSHITVSGSGKVGIANANGSYITVTTPKTKVIAGQSSNNIFAGDILVEPNKTVMTQGSNSNSNYASITIQITAVDITGYYSEGSVLTANVTTTPATVLYQWQKSADADGTYENIAGATSNAYTLTADEVGKYLKVTATGTGNYSGTVTSNPSKVIGAARIEGTAITYVYAGSYAGTSNMISLFDTEYKEASICEDLANWAIDTGTTNLYVSSITRNSDQTATINYSLKVAGQGTGTGTISIKAKATTVETNLDTNAININIVEPAYSVSLGTLTRVTGDTQSTVSTSSSSAAEGSQVILTVIPKAGMQLKPNTLKAQYNDGTLKEAVLSGSGPYTFTMPAYPVVVTAEFIVPAQIEGTAISYVYTGGGFTGTSNTISLFNTYYMEASTCEDLANWTIDTGTTNLFVSSITRNNDETATINYSLKVDGQGTGTGTISIKVKAAAIGTNTDTNVININIVAPTYSVTLGAITRETGDTQSTVTMSSASVAEGSQVTLTVIPKAGAKLTLNTLKAQYNDGTFKEAVLSGSGPYTFTMPAYPVVVTAEFEFIYTNVKFTTIGAEVNGYGMDGAHGSADIPGEDLFFLGVTASGNGYFKVYDTGGLQPGVSGGNPSLQAYLLITTLYDSFDVTIKQFKVYNPNALAVTLTIGGWDNSSPYPPSGSSRVSQTATAAAQGWTTVYLEGFIDLSTLTIDFPDDTPLYFNEFLVRP